MSTVLHDLYYGRISPWEHRPTSNEESRKISRKIEDEKRYFVQKMSLDDCQRFQELENLYTQSSDIEQLDAFSCGVKLGAELIIAVFTESR